MPVTGKEPPLLAVALALALSAPASADPVDALLARQQDRAHIPGVALAVVEDGKVAKLAGYGLANVEWRGAVDADTPFQLASATKVFTGIALMRLVEQGKLTLDAPLTAFFPEAPEAWRGITVRQLASHTSGLPDDLGQPRPETVEEIVAAAQRTPLAYAPGTESRYGFTDFVVLRAVMEKVSGRSLPDLFRDELVTPLGLTATAFNFARQQGVLRSARLLPRAATTYGWSEGALVTSDFLYGEPGYAAGGLFSSARDLSRVFVALDEGRLLKPESLRELQTAARLKDGKSAGFGVAWAVRSFGGTTVTGHSGGPALADVLRFPDRKLTIIALANQRRYYPLLAEAIAELRLPAPAIIPVEDREPALLTRLKTLLADAAEGRVDAAGFDAEGQKESVPFLADFGGALLAAVGPVKRAVLLRDETADGLRTRTHLVEFADKTMRWRLVTTAEGLVRGLYPVGEDD
jgi:CubicO group peptidase (beta-lactamase class C family)